jgi:hypothetical protein
VTADAVIGKDDPMDLDEVADELYGAEPEQFIELRKARAAEARAAGDRDLAKQITQLRRPTRSAWVVNLLSGQAAQELTDLLDLGAALAEAQQRLSVAELRKLSSQRHAAIAALVRRGSQLAEVHGHTATESTLREVSDTLQAALSDPSVAEVVRAGHLSQAQEYGGFGPQFGFGTPSVDGAAGVAPRAPAGERRADRRPDQEADQAADQAADQDVAQEADQGTDQVDQAERDRMIDRLNTAQQALDRIRDQSRRTAEQLGRATETADQRAQRVDQLREQLDRAEREADKAVQEVRRLQKQAEELDKAKDSAEDAVSEAVSRLADS